MERREIEAKVQRALASYKLSAEYQKQMMESKSPGDRAALRKKMEANEAEGVAAMVDIAVDTLAVLHGLNAHLGRIAIAMEKMNEPLPPADRLFNQA